MEAQPNSRYDALTQSAPEKVAGWGDGSINPTADEAARSGQLANKKLWQFILAAGGLGALGRSALGLMHVAAPGKARTASPSSQTVPVALPQQIDEEEEKYAQDKSAGIFGDLYNKLVKSTEDLPWGETAFWGRGSSTPGSNPALLALGIPGAALAGYGGWKGVDKVMDARRKSERKDEYEEAQDEYQRLLNATMSKHSADADGIEAELDELAELAMNTEKQAGYLSDIGSMGIGGISAYAILAALMSGKLSYDYFKSRNQQDISEEALQRRTKERFGGMAPIRLQPSTEVV